MVKGVSIKTAMGSGGVMSQPLPGVLYASFMLSKISRCDILVARIVNYLAVNRIVKRVAFGKQFVAPHVVLFVRV